MQVICNFEATCNQGTSEDLPRWMERMWAKCPHSKPHKYDGQPDTGWSCTTRCLYLYEDSGRACVPVEDK